MEEELVRGMGGGDLLGREMGVNDVGGCEEGCGL